MLLKVFHILRREEEDRRKLLVMKNTLVVNYLVTILYFLLYCPDIAVRDLLFCGLEMIRLQLAVLNIKVMNGDGDHVGNVRHE